MRACVIYFSQTGNTEAVAKAIQEELAATTGFCALYRLEEADPAFADRYDLIGLGTPAFYFREPANVRRFLLDMPAQNGSGQAKPFFSFVTHGGTPGHAAQSLEALAASRGLALLDHFQCLGVDTYPPFSGRDPLSGQGHPDLQDLHNARAFSRAVLEKADRYLEERIFERPRLPGSGAHAAAALFREQNLRWMMRHGPLPAKKIVATKCTKCGLCVENCPRGIIKLDPYPVIDEAGCIACYECQRICPQAAIDCDWRLFKLITGAAAAEFLQRLFAKKNA